MKRRNYAFGKFIVLVTIVLCGSLGFSAGPEKPAKAAEPQPAASPTVQKIVFNSPADAFTQYAATNDPAVKSAVKDYLQQTIDQTPRDPAAFSAACAQLIKILSQERTYDKVVQVCLNQLGSEQGVTNIYTAALSLADAYIALNDAPKAGKALEDLLDKYRAPDLFPGAWAKAIALYQQQKQPDRIIQLCAKHLGKETDQRMINIMITTLSGTYADMGDYPNAAKALDTYLEKNRSQAAPANVVAVTKTLSGIYAKNLGQTNEAVAAIDREIKFMQASLTQIGSGQDTNNIYAAILTLPDAYIAIDDPQKAENALEELLDKYYSPANFPATWAKLIALYQQQKQPDRIIQLCAKYLGKVTDPQMIYSMTLLYSGTYAGMGDYPNVAKALDTYLEKNRFQAAPANVVAVAKTLSGIYIKNLGQTNEALASLDREIKYLSSSNTIAQQVELMNAKAEMLYATVKDLPRATTEYQKVVAMGAQVPDALLSEASFKLAQVYNEMGQKDQAGQTLLDFLKKSNYASSPLVAQQLIGYEVSEQQLMKAVWALREQVAAQSAGSTAVDRFQPDIVKLLLAARKQQEALQEARVFLYTCSEKSVPSAIELIATTYKMMDMNLARANNFLKYQKFGPTGEDGKLGTEDDLKDLLKDIPPLSIEQRTQLFADKLSVPPKGWADYRKRADIYLYLEQPLEAFQALKKSFELCPMAEKDLQSATDALTGFIIRNTRDVALAESLVQFIMFGPAGKDSKAGTADDLKDPTPEIIRKIQYVQQQRVTPGPEAKQAEPAKPSPAKSSPAATVAPAQPVKPEQAAEESDAKP